MILGTGIESVQMNAGSANRLFYRAFHHVAYRLLLLVD